MNKAELTLQKKKKKKIKLFSILEPEIERYAENEME